MRLSGPLANTATAPSNHSANAKMNGSACIASLVDLAQCVRYRTDMDCRLFVMLNPVTLVIFYDVDRCALNRVHVGRPTERRFRKSLPRVRISIERPPEAARQAD